MKSDPFDIIDLSTTSPDVQRAMARFYIVRAEIKAEQAGKPATLRRSIHTDTGPTDAEYEAAVLGEDLNNDDP